MYLVTLVLPPRAELVDRTAARMVRSLAAFNDSVWGRSHRWRPLPNMEFIRRAGEETWRAYVHLIVLTEPVVYEEVRKAWSESIGQPGVCDVRRFADPPRDHAGPVDPEDLIV